jgi:hypothetical protein
MQTLTPPTRLFMGSVLANVRKYKLMPEEVYSVRNRLADDGTLSKVLFYDIVH